MTTKQMMVCALAALLVAASGVQASTIRDNPGYVPSSGLTLGPVGTEWGGETGFTITDPFQINLEYQPGILNSVIDAFNAYDPHGTADLNFPDNDQYVLKIDPAGGLSTWTYPNDVQPDSGSLNVQWTLTGWHQTILAGHIETYAGGGRLVVDPSTQYRPFPNDIPVNDVEVFDGLVTTEVVAYTFTGDVGDIGAGAVLGVERITPEPTSVAVWALLGIGGLGMIRLRRK